MRYRSLQDADAFLKHAESVPNAAFAAGLHFCKGLHAWFTNNSQAALAEFNFCRQDAEWSRPALMNMIEIYLNPDNRDSFFEAVESKGSDNASYVAAAEKLIQDLRSMGETSPKVDVLQAYALMARRDRSAVDQSIELLSRIINANRSYVPALLALANAFIIRGDTPKARNNLKIISKQPFNMEFSTDFERAYLMLADTYIQVLI